MPKGKKQQSVKKKPDGGLLAELIEKPLKALDDLLSGKVFDGPRKKSDDDDERSEEVSDDDGDEDAAQDEDDEPAAKRRAEKQSVDINILHHFRGEKSGGKRKRAPEPVEPDAADSTEEDGEAAGK